MKGSALSTSGSKDLELLIDGRRSKVRRLTLGESRARLWSMVKRAPEVIVKVTGGGKTTKHVLKHMDYITRHGELEAHTDQGEVILGKPGVRELLDSWDLDISKGQGKLRQAFNIVLSMPEGTPPQKVLAAAQKFAREKFWGDHQYMMVLHEPETDPHKEAKPHPHVHLVVKAENHQGQRLYIRKATLEAWRQDFAQYMREQGVEAMATPREVRGVTMKPKKTGPYRAEKRGESTVLKKKLGEITKDLKEQGGGEKPWEDAIAAKRVQIVRAVLGAAKEMEAAGDPQLAAALGQYARDLPPLETERHVLTRELLARIEKGRDKGTTQEQQRAPEAGKDR
jgi:hypothetical protein